MHCFEPKSREKVSISFWCVPQNYQSETVFSRDDEKASYRLLGFCNGFNTGLTWKKLEHVVQPPTFKIKYWIWKF